MLFWCEGVIGQTETFDELNANLGQNKEIEWYTSTYGNGYGHKIYNTDPGFGNKTLLNFAGRNNNSSWSDILTLTSNGRVGIGTTDPSVKFEVNGTTHFLGEVKTFGTNWVFNNDNQQNATIWLNKPTSGPASVGHYYIKTYDYWGAYLHFQGTGDNGNEKLNVTFDGKVGIGTTTPDHFLTVAGTMNAREIIVETSAGADFVFEDEYKIPKLEDVEAFIKENKHLPNIPSAEEMISEGVKVGELQIQLLQKIEELTLYVIELNKENEELKKQVQKIAKVE